MKSRYTLHNKHLDGYVEVDYFQGHLNAVKMKLKEPFTVDQFNKFFLALPRLESDINSFEDIHLKVKKVDVYAKMAPHEKIALFCLYHEKHKGFKYKATGVDGKRIAEFRVDDEILSAYFTSKMFAIRGAEGSAGHHSIQNFLTYYNPLIAEMKAKDFPKVESNYPDYYSPKFENGLSEAERPKYWAHLRGLGLKVKKIVVGTVTTTQWVKEI